MTHLTTAKKLALTIEIEKAIREAVHPILERYSPDHCIECVMRAATAASIKTLSLYGSYTLGSGVAAIAEITGFVGAALLIEQRQRALEDQASGQPPVDFDCPSGRVH